MTADTWREWRGSRKDLGTRHRPRQYPCAHYEAPSSCNIGAAYAPKAFVALAQPSPAAVINDDRDDVGVATLQPPLEHEIRGVTRVLFVESDDDLASDRAHAPVLDGEEVVEELDISARAMPPVCIPTAPTDSAEKNVDEKCAKYIEITALRALAAYLRCFGRHAVQATQVYRSQLFDADYRV